jgi:hypothetical protein
MHRSRRPTSIAVVTLPAVAAAWPMPTPEAGVWDFTPLLYAVALLVAAGLGGIRPRWWGVGLAVAGGLPCANLAEGVGLWAALLVTVTVFVVARTIARHQQHA